VLCVHCWVIGTLTVCTFGVLLGTSLVERGIVLLQKDFRLLSPAGSRLLTFGSWYFVSFEARQAREHPSLDSLGPFATVIFFLAWICKAPSSNYLKMLAELRYVLSLYLIEQKESGSSGSLRMLRRSLHAPLRLIRLRPLELRLRNFINSGPHGQKV
jgi:hypothetical protein